MLTSAHLKAREGFNLDAAMLALPPRSPPAVPESSRGPAGWRCSPRYSWPTPEAKLRAFAAGVLGARRVSPQYLKALRIVLGNIDRASRIGYRLEVNVRTRFATERTMRTLLAQLRGAYITHGKPVALGHGRCQVVQCFGHWRADCAEEDAAAELERSYREAEARMPDAPPLPADPAPFGINESEAHVF